MGLTADQLTYARMLLSDTGSSAVQSVQLSVGTIGGTFTLTVEGQTTAPIAWNAPANVVQNALTALSTIGVGNLSVQNAGPLTSYYLYFTGVLANTALSLVTANASGLIGTPTPSITVLQLAQGGVYAFTDADLDLFYSQAQQNFYRAIQYAYMALVADLSRLNDYVAGQSQEKVSQRYTHVREQVAYYAQWANADRQVQPVQLESVPPTVRAVPVTSGVPATSLRYSPNRNPWRNKWGW